MSTTVDRDAATALAFRRRASFSEPTPEARDAGPLACMSELLDAIERRYSAAGTERHNQESGLPVKAFDRMEPHVGAVCELLREATDKANAFVFQPDELEHLIIGLCESGRYEWLPVFILSLAHERANGEPRFDRTVFGRPEPASLLPLTYFLTMIISVQRLNGTTAEDRRSRFEPMLRQLLSGRSLFERPSPLAATEDERRVIREEGRNGSLLEAKVAVTAGRNPTDFILQQSARATSNGMEVRNRWLVDVLSPATPEESQ